MEQLYREIISNIGEDIFREELVNTPKRASESIKFLTSGYTKNLDEIVNNAIFESNNDEMVVVKNIELFSMCEHHLLPFIGQCHVAYIPNGKVLGLSKIARITDMFARRLQIQENLTIQIANAVQKVTGASGVAVLVEAKHLCMMMRGVSKQNSKMVTSCMLGDFKKSSDRYNTFMSLIK